MQALGLWHTSKLVAWYPTSSKVPLCQYMIYGTDHSASMINWHWWSCYKLVITFVRGLYVIILALALRPAALGLDANIWGIALALVQYLVLLKCRQGWVNSMMTYWLRNKAVQYLMQVSVNGCLHRRIIKHEKFKVHLNTAACLCQN